MERRYDYPQYNDATLYWHDAAEDFVEQLSKPRDSPQFVLAYQLYILSVFAAAEYDRQQGAIATDSELLNIRFRQGIAVALGLDAEHDTEDFIATFPDKSAREWDELIAHGVSKIIRVVKRTRAMPTSYLGTLQALSRGELTINIPSTES